jgi:uncharacterized protein (TIGR04552 family)
MDTAPTGYRALEQFSLHDVEAIRTILRGDSVIDWQRMFLTDVASVDEFLRTHELNPDDAGDVARMEAIRDEAIEYLRRNFDYPIPRAVATQTVQQLMLAASGKGHRQVCACVILKVMHIIHHLAGRELLYMLPLSDAQVFQLVEEKVYRIIGGMMADGLPLTEFLGGRKNRDSLYTKLLSKTETIAAQIYDKLRFRVVTRTTDDVLPVLNYLSRRLFPYNYVIPAESKNTLVDPRAVAAQNPNFAQKLRSPLSHGRAAELSELVDNKFSAKSYRVIHFVVDLPVRIPREVLASAPPTARQLGGVVFVLTEFQLVDQESELRNTLGDASHEKYKERQRVAVRDRLRLGVLPTRRSTRPPSPSVRPRGKG